MKLDFYLLSASARQALRLCLAACFYLICLVPAHGQTISVSPDTSVRAWQATELVHATITTSGSFGAGNHFTVELSDSSGSFASPLQLKDTVMQQGGRVSFQVPAQVKSFRYRIRARASSPAMTGAQSGLFLVKGFLHVSQMPSTNLFFGDYYHNSAGDNLFDILVPEGVQATVRYFFYDELGTLVDSAEGNEVANTPYVSNYSSSPYLVTDSSSGGKNASDYFFKPGDNYFCRIKTIDQGLQRYETPLLGPFRFPIAGFKDKNVFVWSGAYNLSAPVAPTFSGSWKCYWLVKHRKSLYYNELPYFTTLDSGAVFSDTLAEGNFSEVIAIVRRLNPCSGCGEQIYARTTLSAIPQASVNGINLHFANGQYAHLNNRDTLSISDLGQVRWEADFIAGSGSIDANIFIPHWTKPNGSPASGTPYGSGYELVDTLYGSKAMIFTMVAKPGWPAFTQSDTVYVRYVPRSIDSVRLISRTQLCPYESDIRVGFRAKGVFAYDGGAAGFSAQLSDSSGSFDNPQNIGQVTGQDSTVIRASFYSSFPEGKHYRIRVIGGATSYIGDTSSYFTITPAPSVAILGPDSVASGQPFALLALDTTGVSATYHWSLAGALIDTVFGPSVDSAVYLLAQSAYVYLRAVSDSGCGEAQSSKIINVGGANLLSVAVAEPDSVRGDTLFMGERDHQLTLKVTLPGVTHIAVTRYDYEGAWRTDTVENRHVHLHLTIDSTVTALSLSALVAGQAPVSFWTKNLDLVPSHLDSVRLLGSSALCASGEFALGFQHKGPFDGSYNFSAELSDSSGSFDNATYVGGTSGKDSVRIAGNLYSSPPAGSHYRLRVLGHDRAGRQIAASSAFFAINPVAQAQIVCPDTVFAGQPLALSNAYSMPASYAYAWRTAGASSDSFIGQIADTVSYQTRGAKLVELTVASTGCGQATVQKVVQVVPPRILSIRAIGRDSIGNDTLYVRESLDQVHLKIIAQGASRYILTQNIFTGHIEPDTIVSTDTVSISLSRQAQSITLYALGGDELSNRISIALIGRDMASCSSTPVFIIPKSCSNQTASIQAIHLAGGNYSVIGVSISSSIFPIIVSAGPFSDENIHNFFALDEVKNNKLVIAYDVPGCLIKYFPITASTYTTPIIAELNVCKQFTRTLPAVDGLQPGPGYSWTGLETIGHHLDGSDVIINTVSLNSGSYVFDPKAYPLGEGQDESHIVQLHYCGITKDYTFIVHPCEITFKPTCDDDLHIEAVFSGFPLPSTYTVTWSDYDGDKTTQNTGIIDASRLSFWASTVTASISVYGDILTRTFFYARRDAQQEHIYADIIDSPDDFTGNEFSRDYFFDGELSINTGTKTLRGIKLYIWKGLILDYPVTLNIIESEVIFHGKEPISGDNLTNGYIILSSINTEEATLIFESCFIHSTDCGYMWRGIAGQTADHRYSNSGGRLKISNSTIEDCYEGVGDISRVSGHPRYVNVEVQNSNFNSNYKSVSTDFLAEIINSRFGFNHKLKKFYASSYNFPAIINTNPEDIRPLIAINGYFRGGNYVDPNRSHDRCIIRNNTISDHLYGIVIEPRPQISTFAYLDGTQTDVSFTMTGIHNVGLWQQGTLNASLGVESTVTVYPSSSISLSPGHTGQDTYYQSLGLNGLAWPLASQKAGIAITAFNPYSLSQSSFYAMRMNGVTIEGPQNSADQTIGMYLQGRSMEAITNAFTFKRLTVGYKITGLLGGVSSMGADWSIQNCSTGIEVDGISVNLECRRAHLENCSTGIATTGQGHLITSNGVTYKDDKVGLSVGSTNTNLKDFHCNSFESAANDFNGKKGIVIEVGASLVDQQIAMPFNGDQLHIAGNPAGNRFPAQPTGPLVACPYPATDWAPMCSVDGWLSPVGWKSIVNSPGNPQITYNRYFNEFVGTNVVGDVIVTNGKYNLPGVTPPAIHETYLIVAPTIGPPPVRPDPTTTYTVDGCTFETAYFPTVKTSGPGPKPPVLSASPNPTSGGFVVELSEGLTVDTEADLYGPFGSLPICSKRLDAKYKQVSFDASALPPGCYQVKLRGTPYSTRVVVQ